MTAPKLVLFAALLLLQGSLALPNSGLVFERPLGSIKSSRQAKQNPSQSLGSLSPDMIFFMGIRPLTHVQVADLFTKLYTSTDPVISYVRSVGLEKAFDHYYKALNESYPIEKELHLMQNFEVFQSTLEGGPLRIFRTKFDDFFYYISSGRDSQVEQTGFNTASKLYCAMHGAFERKKDLKIIKVGFVTICVDLRGATWTQPMNPEVISFLNDLVTYKIIHS